MRLLWIILLAACSTAKEPSGKVIYERPESVRLHQPPAGIGYWGDKFPDVWHTRPQQPVKIYYLLYVEQVDGRKVTIYQPVTKEQWLKLKH